MRRIGLNKQIVSKSFVFNVLILIILVFSACTNNGNKSSQKNDSAEIKNHLGLTNEQLTKDSALINHPVNGIYESFALDELPIFPGGDKGLTNYVAKHIVYPQEAKRKGIEGKVYVRFVVTKTGKIGETDIMRTVDALLEMEALRVVKSLPKWTPGKKNGKPVDVWLILPVEFRLK